MEIKNTFDGEPDSCSEDEASFTPSSSMADGDITDATFPFTKLPIEIRTKIWKLQIPPPRIIKLTYYLHTGTEVIQTPVLATPLLHTCSEARKIASEFYKIGFEGCTKPAHPIYIDWNRDTIWLERQAGRADYNVCSMKVPRSAFDVAWQTSVRHLAISFPRLKEDVNAPFTRPWKLDYFGGLKTLTLEVMFVNGAPDPACDIEGRVSDLKRRWTENASFGPDGHWPKIQFIEQGTVKKITGITKVSIDIQFVSWLCINIE